ncbi:MAG: (d)CMP kinase [Nocardioides sp.]
MTQAIREDEVNAAVSAVSAVPAARARLLALQREIIGAGGIVVEGRDIGSVVAPEAPVKVYLTADAGPGGAPRGRGRRHRHRHHPGVDAAP